MKHHNLLSDVEFWPPDLCHRILRAQLSLTPEMKNFEGLISLLNMIIQPS